MNTITKDEIDVIVKGLQKFDDAPNYNFMTPYSSNIKTSHELRQAE